MADIHNQLKRSRGLLTAFQDAFALGGEAGVERLGETLTPVVDFWSLPELALLANELLQAECMEQPAVAAQYPFVALLNPADSQCLIRLESIIPAVAAVVACTLTGTIVGNVPAGVVTIQTRGRDLRRLDDAGASLTGRATMRRGTDVNIDVAGAPQELLWESNTSIRPFQSLPWVIPPGRAAFVALRTVNTSLAVSMGWRERQLLPSEL